MAEEIVTPSRASRVFGKRATQHTIIIASGERIRHLTVRPWAVALTACFLAVFVIGYFAATTYLILRDDLIGATMARQARMQHSYEDRIAALRAQVDRVTSRQLLDQQVMEDKVATLIAHQQALSFRHGRLDDLLERAEAGMVESFDPPVPTPKPQLTAQKHAGAATALDAISLVTGSLVTGSLANGSLRPAVAEAESGEVETPGPAPLPGILTGYAPLRVTRAEEADRIFSQVTLSLKSIERQQFEKVRRLTNDAFETVDAIETVLRETGLGLPADLPADGVGGPFIEPDAATDFETSLDDLDLALARLDEVRRHALHMPLSHPVPGKSMTSRYGTRTDPFLNRTAFHAGTDFRVAEGEAVLAAGQGKVVSAGKRGGYGNMVEIDHGDGVTTRYAHLSGISVVRGQLVAPGERIGAAGSTGRSTGPHLHYEVRREGKPLDPARFIVAARTIGPLLASD